MGKSLNRSDFAGKLERVKGIEPSYSAWKAAALPLSYTRLTRSTITPGRPPQPAGADLIGQTTLVPPALGPLTSAESVPILMFPSTQRKEVIQCLLPSAVTSLGSPARL